MSLYRDEHSVIPRISRTVDGMTVKKKNTMIFKLKLSGSVTYWVGVIFLLFFCFVLNFKQKSHTHTHTHIYIYIYIYIAMPIDDDDLCINVCGVCMLIYLPLSWGN